ncbi:DDE-type integrase/transposase/recombinase [Bdellovibrionota bacterium FG-1]
MSWDDEIDERRRAVALFRYAVIGELEFEGLNRGELSARIQVLSEKKWKMPDGEEYEFTARTLWNWWMNYKREGLKGLLPASRKTGPREISPEVLKEAIQARKEVPSRSTRTLIRVLELKNVVPRGKLKRSTLDRILDEAGESRRKLKTLGNKRFTRLLFSQPNEFWVGDYHEAPILWVPARQTYDTVHMGAVIDHYSKYVPHGEWYPNERIATLEDTIKQAFLTRGLPKKMYVDNGSVYRSHDFAFALTHLDVRLVHSKAYQSEGRGVIERFNRTVAEGFEPEARAAKITDLPTLNRFWIAWLEESYHLVIHGSTGEKPMDRFTGSGFVPKYPDPVKIQDIFRVKEKRKVHPKTGTVEVETKLFQCENFLRGRWVQVLFDPFKLDDVLIVLKGKHVQRAFPQKVNDPQPKPERPTAAQLSFDYLGALRAEYDRRIAMQARHISVTDFKPSPEFSLQPFLGLCAQMLGKSLSAYEKENLTRTFNGVGPFSEKVVRLALEHAMKLRGRGLHVSVYTHYLKVFHFAALNANRDEAQNVPKTDKKKETPDHDHRNPSKRAPHDP